MKLSKSIIMAMPFLALSLTAVEVSAANLDRFRDGSGMQQELPSTRIPDQDRRGACLSRYECKDNVRKGDCKEKRGQEWSDKHICSDIGMSPEI